MTVRHHLARLEADGLVAVASDNRRGSVGRPAHAYSLTDAADDLFPKAYDRLARLLLDEFSAIRANGNGTASPLQDRDALMQRLAERAATPHRERLSRLHGEERVRTAADILQAESGFTELNANGAGPEVLDYNCIYRRVAESDDDDVCVFHTKYVSELMGIPVRLTTCQRTGDVACCFNAAAGAETATGPHDDRPADLVTQREEGVAVTG